MRIRLPQNSEFRRVFRFLRIREDASAVHEWQLQRFLDKENFRVRHARLGGDHDEKSVLVLDGVRVVPQLREQLLVETEKFAALDGERTKIKPPREDEQPEKSSVFADE